MISTNLKKIKLTHPSKIRENVINQGEENYIGDYNQTIDILSNKIILKDKTFFKYKKGDDIERNYIFKYDRNKSSNTKGKITLDLSLQPDKQKGFQGEHGIDLDYLQYILFLWNMGDHWLQKNKTLAISSIISGVIGAIVALFFKTII